MLGICLALASAFFYAVVAAGMNFGWPLGRAPRQEVT
ncbi:hypothetical protein M2397_001419 [Pseudomonas sp. BIGb0381]|nr:hypothetical protein [Pseudomonas sp. SJZ073]MBB6310559.1 hypothetical protein [Pseudomonas sp. JAI120]MCS4311126.1 hypothetical protein [Pseudomonas sp. BIGb0381]